jgi:hypothetical protein
VNQPNTGPNPLEAIGLPATWAPVPISWRFASLNVQGPGGTEQVWVLIVDAPTGRQAYALPRAAMQSLRDQITQQVSGIEVARAVVVPGGPNGRN